jgi:hypothetical protein
MLPWYIGSGDRFYDRHEQLEAVFTRACFDDLPKDPEEYWKIVGEVWKRTEYPHLQIEAWLSIFSLSPGPNRYTQEWLKNPKVVYRGMNEAYQDIDCDWSWTADYQKAEWFAYRDYEVMNKIHPELSHAPLIKQFDCGSDTYRVWCVFEDDTENEVLLWSPIARDVLECYKENQYA